MREIELQVPPDVAYVGLARLVVTTAARQSGMDDGRVEDLKIAVSEATTNAILGQRRVGPEQPVVLRFGPSGPRFEVTVQDAGQGGEGVWEAANGESESGLGVTVIRGLVDDVELLRDGDGRVHMRFTIGLGDTQPSR